MTASENTTRFVLVWMDEIESSRLVQIRRRIEDSLLLPRREVEVDLWIESPGGDAHSAYKLATLLRHVASHVRVVVPDYAKSAATLLTLVGDEIYMGPSAELGPLDAQLPQEGSFAPISALNIAKAADEVARDAVDLAIRGGSELLLVTGLSRAETLNAMLRFSADFSKPLVCQLDPKLVHQAKELLRVTARYAEDLLRDNLDGDAYGVAQRLVEDFPTHSYVITPRAASDLGLSVKPLSEYDQLAAARVVHRAAEDGRSIVQFGPLDDLVQALGDDDEEGGENDIEAHETDEHYQDTRKPAEDGAEPAGTRGPGPPSA